MPNSRTDSPVTHSEAGGLSTVMKFWASSDPKNHADQLCEPAWDAAAYKVLPYPLADRFHRYRIAVAASSGANGHRDQRPWCGDSRASAATGWATRAVTTHTVR